jgi:hypothetical protein
MKPSQIRFQVLRWGVVLSLGGILLSSCGDDAKSDSSDQPEETGGVQSPAPALAPSPLPESPLPSPSPCPSLACAPCPPPPMTPAWVSVQEYKDCPYPDCIARMGFEVNWSGHFLYGEGPQSQLSRFDLSQVSELAEAVVEQNLLSSPTCVTLPPLVGRSGLRVYITSREGLISLVYQFDQTDNSLCWRGNRGRAEDLAEGLDRLATQYQP